MTKQQHDEFSAVADRYTSERNFARDEPHVDVSGKTQAISLRFPEQQLAILKHFAHLEGTGYQRLIKRWLDERLRDEVAQMNQNKTSKDVIVSLRRTVNAAMRQLSVLEPPQAKAK